MNRFVRVAAIADIPAGKARLVNANGKSIALFNVGGEVYALDDSCPHAGSSLAAGRLDGAMVACRAHGLRFDVRTGRMRGVVGLCAKSYPVQVVEGEIAVGIDEAEGVPFENDACNDQRNGAPARCVGPIA